LQISSIQTLSGIRDEGQPGRGFCARLYNSFQFLDCEDPLKDPLFLSPVLVVIDALDESEDASITSSNRIPFHTFLGQHLSELPSNFRILITCRPEAGILDAFPASLSVRHMQMDDPDLSSGIDEDIRTYLRTSLSGTSVDENELYGLTRKAERLFQWAFVASQYIANPPAGLDFRGCIERAIKPTKGKGRFSHLDALYKMVLERFEMDDPEISENFRYIMGRILGAYQPLSIASLNTCPPVVIPKMSPS